MLPIALAEHRNETITSRRHKRYWQGRIDCDRKISRQSFFIRAKSPYGYKGVIAKKSGGLPLLPYRMSHRLSIGRATFYARRVGRLQAATSLLERLQRRRESQLMNKIVWPHSDAAKINENDPTSCLEWTAASVRDGHLIRPFLLNWTAQYIPVVYTKCFLIGCVSSCGGERCNTHTHTHTQQNSIWTGKEKEKESGRRAKLAARQRRVCRSSVSGRIKN